MSLPPELVDALLDLPPAEAWRRAGDHAWSVCCPPVDPGRAAEEIVARDRSLQPLDLLLAGAAWDLWEALADSVPAAAGTLRAWWAAHPPGRAVLILDGLSLREVPWLLEGAPEHGLRVTASRWLRAEAAGDTVSFARTLGLQTRSDLQNDGAGASFALRPARTEAADMPFEDCARLVGSEPDVVFWHSWPDLSVHLLAPAGKGLPHLAREARDLLGGEGFWALVRRLAEGRRMVLTADHGYAASGLFEDAPEDQGRYLKDLFRSGRSGPSGGEAGAWLPPADLALEGGRHAVGRRRWKSQGGYPTLAHGGLTVLERLVPYLELEVAR